MSIIKELPAKESYSLLFVCLGNICRSPLAEGIFRDMAQKRGLGHRFSIDSAGTGGWHIGERPHTESRRIAKLNGVLIDTLRARQLSKRDRDLFDLFVAMDQQNRDDIVAFLGSTVSVVCLREFDEPQGELDIPDPYFGGPDGFDAVYKMIHHSCERLIRQFESYCF